MLDNETSGDLKHYLAKEKVSFQLVPPKVCGKNAAERCMRTFKNHLISILCGVHPNFPLNLWCKLLEQTEMTLNMLRLCRCNPKLSAYTTMEGEFSHNHTPIAPVGSKVIAHDHAD